MHHRILDVFTRRKIVSQGSFPLGHVDSMLIQEYVSLW
jgi:hypothetical protein